MKVYVKIKPTKKGYAIYNKAMVKIATVDRLNLENAYVTHKKGIRVICGSYVGYCEDVIADHKLSEINNLALDTVIMTGYDVYCQPTGTLLERQKNNS